MKRPDEGRRASLAAVIRSDVNAVRKLSAEVRTLPSGAGFAECAAVAYALHSIYCAIENSFDQISRTFENHVVDMARWHRELLSKMFLEIPTVRPRVLPEQLSGVLNEMRSFRHVFRHSYDYQLDPAKLSALSNNWSDAEEQVVGALEAFADWLLDDGGEDAPAR